MMFSLKSFRVFRLKDLAQFLLNLFVLFLPLDKVLVINEVSLAKIFVFPYAFIVLILSINKNIQPYIRVNFTIIWVLISIFLLNNFSLDILSLGKCDFQSTFFYNILALALIIFHSSIYKDALLRSLKFFAIGFLVIVFLFLTDNIIYYKERIGMMFLLPNSLSFVTVLASYIYLYYLNIYLCKRQFYHATPLLILYALSFYIVILTQSRAGTLALFFGIFLLFFFSKRRIFSFLFLIVLAVVIFLHDSVILDRIFMLSQFELGGRLSIWSLIQDNFSIFSFFGNGRCFFQHELYRLTGSTPSTHLFFLTNLLYGGILSLILSLYLFYYLFVRVFRNDGVLPTYFLLSIFLLALLISLSSNMENSKISFFIFALLVHRHKLPIK